MLLSSPNYSSSSQSGLMHLFRRYFNSLSPTSRNLIGERQHGAFSSFYDNAGFYFEIYLIRWFTVLSVINILPLHLYDYNWLGLPHLDSISHFSVIFYFLFLFFIDFISMKQFWRHLYRMIWCFHLVLILLYHVTKGIS